MYKLKTYKLKNKVHIRDQENPGFGDKILDITLNIEPPHNIVTLNI